VRSFTSTLIVMVVQTLAAGGQKGVGAAEMLTVTLSISGPVWYIQNIRNIRTAALAERRVTLCYLKHPS
jgi:hypothetical protein